VGTLNKVYKLSANDIAKKLGVSHTSVGNLLILYSMDANILELIPEKISATKAIEFVIEYGDDAYERIMMILERVESEGSKRVTDKVAKDKPKVGAKEKNYILDCIAENLPLEDLFSQITKRVKAKGNGLVQISFDLSIDDAKEFASILDDYMEV
jgi:hypothetical protein